VTDPSPLVCPSCHSDNTNIGASGSAICRDCAYLWDPDNPALPPTPVLPPFQLPPVDEVFSPALNDVTFGGPASEATDDVVAWLDGAGNPDTYEERVASLMGGGAVLEGGQVATLVAWTDNATVIVRLGNNDLEEVQLSDVQRIMPPVIIPEPAAIPDEPDGFAADMLLAIELAKVIVRAGCEAVTGTGTDVLPGLPPTGYLPSDPDLHPVIERAAGLAVGMLVEQFKLDVDAILEWVGAVSEEVTEGDQQAEVTDAQQTSQDD